MNQYKYLGNVEINLSGYGVVQPGEIIAVDFLINHPLFELQVSKTKITKTNEEVKNTDKESV